MKEVHDLSDLRDFVAMLAEAQKKWWSSPRATPASLLLEYGRDWTVTPQTFRGDPGAQGECYANAGREALRNPDLTYVEGYVLIHGVPIEHAWLADASGNVVDPTLRDVQCDPQYFGIAFSREYLRDTVMTTKVWGVLDPYINRKIYETPLPASAVA